MTLDAAHPGKSPSPAVVRRAALWLLFLAPFFYLTYGFANWSASQRQSVPHIVFGWEHYVPFIAWTIIPYWSINAFYGLSLFVNDSPKSVDRLAQRLLTVQVIAVCCFLAFPLTATFARPETGGLPGFMFAMLGGFDKPFNQAPSLHIALLVVIWDHFRRRISGKARVVWHVWCLLIGASVLTTYQHHSIDIPTGALLGLFALWLIPEARAAPLVGFRGTRDAKSRRLGCCYSLGALALVLAAVAGLTRSGAWLLLLWPALSATLVALGYLGAGADVFQKGADGHVSLASLWLFMPYRLAASLNALGWTRNLPASREVVDGVFLGRFPHRGEAESFASVIDMAGELVPPAYPASTEWQSFPALDLVAVPDATMHQAAEAVEAARQQGPVLICCALGMQRSATAAALWLLKTGRSQNAEEALRLLVATGLPVHVSVEGLRRVLGSPQ